MGCGTSEPAVSTAPSAPETSEAKAAETKAAENKVNETKSTSLPEGILHFGGFERGNPRQCAYLDRPRSDLGAKAEAWIVERQIMKDGFPVSIYGENTPAWAEEGVVYVYCEEKG